MATATVTRPVQALRNRRDAPRPSLSKRHNPMDATGEPVSKRRKLTEPYVRDSHFILAKHAGKPPSLTVHLHETTFRFEGQDISWTYDSTMSCVIRHLKRQTVPHELMEELLSPLIPWYDGCLIVEIQNHRSKAGKEKSRLHSSASNDDGNVKFSMHNYTPHVTPSPMVPFPSKAVTDESADNAVSSGNSAGDMPAPERPKDKDGPIITTVVLHPTTLSLHQEMLILMRTPADQLRGKKRGNDNATPSTGQPPTPQASVPPTPLTQTSRGPLTQSQKMCLEENDWYTFQADLLVTTEPPLFLDPVDNPEDAERVLDMLQHPLHQAQPPSLKTRKRTTAEVAADDAQAAEAERRMLIMDERIKPAGAGAGPGENQSAAASLGFSRFKTLEMVRQRHEEDDRQKKEEDARLAMEKKQQEEQTAAQMKQEQLLQRQRQMQMLQQQQQQQPNQQTIAMQMQMRQARAQQAILNAQAHGHPQANGVMPNGQAGFSQQNSASMVQSSPVVRQQTPMMNSSPMMAQGGFPMVPTSSQGAGSPPRPTSAAMQNPMARQGSQQLPAGRNNTPQMTPGPPGMGQAMPNRATTQTPRMQPGSPAPNMQQGTPTSMSVPMQTPQMATGQMQYTPEQLQMLAQQRQGGQPNGAMPRASPGNHATPDQMIAARNMQQQFANQMRPLHEMLQQAQQQGNLQAAQRLQTEITQKTQAFRMRQQQILQAHANQAMNAQMGGNSSQAGSPGNGTQATPQMAHAHPQQQQPGNNMQDPTQVHLAQQKAQQLAAYRQQNQQAQMQQAHQQLNSLAQQYGGYANIPSQILNTLSPMAQNMLSNHIRQAKLRQQQQQQAMRAQQQSQLGGGEQVPGSQPNPQFMQNIRQNQAMMQQQAQQHLQNQQAAGNNMGMLGMQSFNMPNGMGGMQGGGNNNDLSHHIAAMANALNQPQNQRPGGGNV